MKQYMYLYNHVQLHSLSPNKLKQAKGRTDTGEIH